MPNETTTGTRGVNAPDCASDVARMPWVAGIAIVLVGLAALVLA